MERETNDEFAKRIMKFSPYGALSHAFVIEAIFRYAEQVAAMDTVVEDTGLFNPQSWKRLGQWVKSETNKHLGLAG